MFASFRVSAGAGVVVVVTGAGAGAGTNPVVVVAAADDVLAGTTLPLRVGPAQVAPRLGEYVSNATAAGMEVKAYCTYGQRSNHAPEVFALAQLNGEILLASDTDPVPPPTR